MNRVFHAVLCLVIGSSLMGCGGVHSVIHSETNSAQPSSSPAQAGISSSLDVVKISSPEIKITANGSAEAIVILTISPGYHINANPATFSYLIPTAVSPGKAEGIIAGKPVYPAAQKKKFQFAKEPLAVYEGEVQIKLPLRAGISVARPGWLPISVTVQACDDEKCYPPATLNAMIRWM